MAAADVWRSLAASAPPVRLRLGLAADTWRIPLTGAIGALGTSALGLAASVPAFWSNEADGLVLPALVLMLAGASVLTYHLWQCNRTLDGPLLMIFGATLMAIAYVGGLPEYFVAGGQSAIFHRSGFGVAAL